MTTSRRTLVPSLVLAAFLLGACGDDDSDAGDASADVPTVTVTMEQSRFDPDPVEITAGSEVTFENLDAFAHTVTSAESSEAAFDSGELGQDETFTQVFDEAGTFAYFCEIHPTMRAEVLVS